MKTSIYVACHKKFIKPFKNCRFLKYIEVGRFFHAKKLFKLNDNTGDNISYKNLSYNELTALYWIWKNDKKSDIVGLCHYRRYYQSQNYISGGYKNQILKPKEIKEILNDNDLIAIKVGPFKMSCKERMSFDDVGLRTQDIPLVKKIIFDLYGEDVAQAFDLILERNWNYLLNMFISRKALFDDYCAWLFPILECLEKNVVLDELVGQEKRIFGLWGEYLLSVFIYVKNLKVFECKVVQIEKKQSVFSVLKNRVKTVMRKITKG